MEEITPSNGTALSTNVQDFLDLIAGDGRIHFRCTAEAPTLKDKAGTPTAISISPYAQDEHAQIKSLIQHNERGYSAFYCPQDAGESPTCKTEDIIAYRAIVVDLDGEPLDKVQAFKIKPTCIVETSPGRYQCVYRFDRNIAAATDESEEGLTSEGFKALSTAMAKLLGGDLAVCDGPHVFRTPYFLHWKSGTGFESKLLGTGEKVKFEDLYEAVTGGTAKSSKVSTCPEEEIVPVGKRHEKILKIYCDLAHKGLSMQLVEEKGNEKIKRQVTNAADFLGGKDNAERLNCLKAAVLYRKKEVAKQQQVLEQAFITRKEKSDKAIQEGKEGDFQYDYSEEASIALCHSRYSDDAISDMVHQKHLKHICRLGLNQDIICFSKKSNTWVRQLAKQNGEVKDLVRDCIKDIVNNPDYELNYCTDSKGTPYKHIFEREKETLFGTRLISVANATMNSSSLQKKELVEFDSNPELLFVANGVLNLATGELRAPRAEDCLLNRSNVVWNPKAKCDYCDKVIKDIVAECSSPADMYEFFGRMFGYTISGSVNAHKVFVHRGTGSNGKSVMLDILAALMGSFYTIIPANAFVLSSKGFPLDFVRLGAQVEGKRCGVTHEIPSKSEWNDVNIKKVTGGKIDARAEYEVIRNIRNTCKIHIAVNDIPKPQTQTNGVMRRLVIIPYDREFVEDNRIANELETMIPTEASGLLAKAVRGYQEYKSNNYELGAPKETEWEKEEYKVSHFKADSCVLELYTCSEEEIPMGKQLEWVWLKDIVAEVKQLVMCTAGSTRDDMEQVSNESVLHACKRLGFEYAKERPFGTTKPLSKFKVYRKERKDERLSSL